MAELLSTAPRGAGGRPRRPPPVEVEAEERRDAFGGAGEEITPQRLHEGLDSGVFFSMDANGKRVKQSRSRR